MKSPVTIKITDLRCDFLLHRHSSLVVVVEEGFCRLGLQQKAARDHGASDGRELNKKKVEECKSQFALFSLH